ncbi:carboxypeptidase regulatory-like domain-containing protein [Streptomyces bauhiniae]|uniref:carboxypeptidase regulatory-like domain-containing protein n=1 Tax=Streptomyces bauhiniae TaxID=2340725 RepID=UPI00364AA7E1
MSRSRSGRTPARLAVVTVTAVIAAMTGAGLPAAAGTVAQPADAPPQAAKSSVEQVCDTPGPGRVGCFALRRDDIVGRRGVLAASAPSGYGPDDLRNAYDLPPDGGEGRTVAVVVAYDNPTAESDLAVYRTQFGLPACSTDNGCFRKIDQRGGTDYPQPHGSWAGEASLDLDMVSAAAPGAHLLLVEADSNTFGDIFAAVDQAVAQGAEYVSNSYGSVYDTTPGSGEDPAQAGEFDAHYNHPGVAMVAASGDHGYGVSYPAASQHVTAVGGTALSRSAGSSRGWTESVWHNSFGGPGSGCSAFEPKPAFQTDTGCDKRSVADVAAVADPSTGVAVYQTYGGAGWGVMGGTSASAPIVTGVYAAAGVPAEGTYPNSYPYFEPSALNDVTSGANGSCTTAYLCTARTGYDGPTGLGTPKGTAAFRSYPHGTVSGTVTDSAGEPLARATVTAGGHRTTADAAGRFSLALPPGTYDLAADAYGYRGGTATDVVVTEGGSVTRNFALDMAVHRTVTGKITDGSGHGWPLYATVTVEGLPGAPVFTDPHTGLYTLRVPEDHEYTLTIAAQYPGYQPVTKHVDVTDSDLTLNTAVPVDAEAATAAGYEQRTVGATESFDSTTAAPAGWSVVNADNTVGGWQFADPGRRGNHTTGSGGFAMVDSDHIGSGNRQDSSLVSPVQDFSRYTRPRLAFDSDYSSYRNQSAEIDITTDGGATWTPLRTWTTPLTGHVEVPLNDYAGAEAVQLRFRFTGSWGYWWELDNVFIGDRPFVPVSGGLVAGTVTDANTGDGIVGATVSDDDAPGQSALTRATPDDPQLSDGFYWLFSTTPGRHTFTAAKSRHTPKTRTVRVAPNAVTRSDHSLDAGQLKITTAATDRPVTWGETGTKQLKIRNTGKAPASFTLGERADGLPAQEAKGAPLRLVEGAASPLRQHPSDPGATPAPAAVTPTAAGDAWTSATDLPAAVSDNAVAADGGKLYSAFGYNGSAYTADLYAYDPTSATWSKRAPAADVRAAPAKGFIDGKLYAVGGWGADGSPDAKLEIYDRASDTWTTGASPPKAYAASGSAVLDGKLYVVGGCTATSCTTEDVYAYDPSTDKWSTMARYPEPISWSACGAIDDILYCAGGTADSGATKHAYSYDPVTDAWAPIADLPTTLWGAAHAAANGLLLTVGGRAPAGITNQSLAFDPRIGTWKALPNVSAPVYRGGGAPGFYSVGGKRSNLITAKPIATVDVLTGYDQPRTNKEVTWLGLDRRQGTLLPGASTTVTVSLDASVAEFTRPTTYRAELTVRTDTPYHVAAIPVTMTVAPPKHWGEYAGTVLGATGTGGFAPLAGATVQLSGAGWSRTLTTAEDGTYSLWLDTRGSALTVTVTKEGYRTATTRVKLRKGERSSGDFTLEQTA